MHGAGKRRFHQLDCYREIIPGPLIAQPFIPIDSCIQEHTMTWTRAPIFLLAITLGSSLAYADDDDHHGYGKRPKQLSVGQAPAVWKTE